MNAKRKQIVKARNAFPSNKLKTLSLELEHQAVRIARLEAELGNNMDQVDALSSYLEQTLDVLKAKRLVNEEGSAYQQLIQQLHGAIRTDIPRGATAIVVNKGDPAVLRLKGRTLWHFPRQADGEYAGYYPADSLSAIAQLEALRARGAQYLVFPKPAFWWLDYYSAFKQHLDGRYRVLRKGDNVCVIYSLCDRPDATPENAVTKFTQLIEDFRVRFDRDPTVFDWHGSADLKETFSQLAVCQPLCSNSSQLPYLDASIDIVILKKVDNSTLREAYRVAAAAVVTRLGETDLKVEWQPKIQPSELPAVSIVIPVETEGALTEACIASLIGTLPSNFRGEIIVADDCSTREPADPLGLLANRDGRIRIVRNKRRLGFARTCNKSARLAKGEYLVFVSHDTLLLPGWLSALLQTFKHFPKAGVVGGKLISPEGALLEAGGSVYWDGVMVGCGNGETDLEAPVFSFVREVEYCSSALLATRRALFTSNGGFDDVYQSGSYAAADYAFRLRGKGYCCYYQPECAVVQGGYELKSNRSEQQTFVRRWQNRLKKQFYQPSGLSILPGPSAAAGKRPRPLLVNGCTTSHQRVIVVSSCQAESDCEVGLRRVSDMIAVLRDGGWSVSFLANRHASNSRQLHLLQQQGVQVFDAMKIRIDELFESASFDLVVFVDWLTAERYLPIVRRVSPNTSVIVDSVNSNSMRDVQERLVQKAGSNRIGPVDSDYGPALVRELNLYAAADRVLTASEKEAAWLNNRVAKPNLAQAVPHMPPLSFSPVPLSERRGIVFIGQCGNALNHSAIEFLCREVVPQMNPALTAQHPIYILAETIDDSISRLSEGLPHVLMIDRQPFVEHYLERARVSVIPSCHDSGPSRNLLHILAAGTPAVCTTAGAEVLGLAEGHHVLVADEGKAFADAISTLLTDGTLWRKLSRGVREHFMATHGGRSVQKRMHDLVSSLCCAQPRLPIKNPLAATSGAPATASQEAKRLQAEHEGPIRQLAEQHLPQHAKVMVISAGDPELLKLNGCTAWHFPQDENGSYAGRAPADSQVAIAQLERLRLKGGEFLLLPRASWWWLDHYAEFFSHLSKSYTEVRLEAGTAAVFDLREKKNTPKIATVKTPSSGLTPRRIAIISGEPNTPGHDYRVAMYADALTSLGHEVAVTEYSEIKGMLPLDCLVLWRTPWSDSLGRTVNSAREKGAKIVFDVDDLMFDPALAKIGIIDGIRSQGFAESVIAEFYRNMQKTVQAADFCTCTTKPLATALRRFEKTTFVLPNGFDEIRCQASRRATADKLRNLGDGMIRIGYAGGSRTHQKDFGRLAPAIALLLREHPRCRLVLFDRQEPSGRSPLVDVHEFPELAGLEGQIEWRRVVPARDLPNELARFDINLAPLEVGNVFCEAKSELKYFEAALVNVPTVASPTAPFAEAIQHGRTGFLAASTGEWYDTLKRLVEDSNLRKSIGRAACLDVVWRYGPERRAELARTAYEQIFERESGAAARGFELELRRTTAPRRPLPECVGCEVIFEAGSSTQSEVAVVVPLYNYASYVVEALESAQAQTLARKELIVVDDRSTDDSLRVAEAWMRKNATGFTRIVLLQNHSNAGLPRTRNTGFAFTDAPYVLPLDADNVLLPKCLETCLETIKRTGAAVAYATIRQFGEANHLVSLGQWTAGRFICGNYVDAMALIRRSAWAGVGGYKRMNVTGWEDYELWCRFIEEGLLGVWIPEVLTKYRVHHQSMLKTTTNVVENRNRLAAEMYALHPWLDPCLLAGKR